MSRVREEQAFIPYEPELVATADGLTRGEALYKQLDQRRSVRFFSDAPVPREMVELAIRTASTAPSGAHRQPWQFVVVGDPELKGRMRVAVEQEEQASYEGRMPEEWLDAIRPMGTTWHKPYLTIAPWIVVVFAEQYCLHPDGTKQKNYYVKESVGIACGLFVTALHHMGLATLTHTPSPMGFLSEILARPAHEKPYMLFPIGYPAEGAVVPDLRRKSLDEVSVWFTAPGEP